MSLRVDIITIFPEFFSGILTHGVMRRALASGALRVNVTDLRSATHDRHRTVDDRPFGGGEGMVLKPEPIYEAVRALKVAARAERDPTRETVVLLSAQGRRFMQVTARELSQMERIVLICGRYEGVDERVVDLVADRELSIGDYVLSGGELGAAVILDAVMRLLPGVLGNEASSEFESFGRPDEALPGNDGVPRSTHGAGGLLDYPHYTRPADFLGHAVPEVLSSGNHELIRRWRRERALEKTWRNRPDLLEAVNLSPEDRTFLDKLSGG